ncbi:MAG: PEP-CTERM sorting domain-containing protein [Desulfobacteraceae bacterium]|nr:PEP-CTERM sorting domain-containing protein [Desulfobacteraceae bacterium]
MTGVASADWIDIADVGTYGYFKDDVTGYTWMDNDNMQNMTPLEMQTALSTTGFQLATSAQVNEMSGNRNPHSTTSDKINWYHDTGGPIIGSVSVNMAWGYTIESLDTSTLPNLWAATVNNLHTNNLGDSTTNSVGVWAVNTNIASVPEPATMLLFGIGLLGLAGVNRRKK